MSTCPHIPSTHKPFKNLIQSVPVVNWLIAFVLNVMHHYAQIVLMTMPMKLLAHLMILIVLNVKNISRMKLQKILKRITTIFTKNIKGLVKYITTKPRKIIVLAGAGISTSAGIPDFRTPGTGLYDNLQEYNLPFPEAVFDIDYFEKNPQPFFTLAKELFPGTGKYFPTPTHHFISFLEKKNLLMKIFTQNIDGLEKIVGVSDDKIIYAHGNYFSAHCLKCNKKFDQNQFVDDISNGNIVKCNDCGGLVKPDVVFFGENLPAEFFEGIDLIKTCDLLIVMGTSLTVHPFASLVNYTKSGCPRILINMDDVGSFEKPNDLKLLGKCDDTIMDLVDAFGWRDEFVSFMDSFK